MEGGKEAALTVAFSALMACGLVNPNAVTMAMASSGGPNPAAVAVDGFGVGGTKALEKSDKKCQPGCRCGLAPNTPNNLLI